MSLPNTTLQYITHVIVILMTVELTGYFRSFQFVQDDLSYKSCVIKCYSSFKKMVTWFVAFSKNDSKLELMY